jgi:hypothetical protein
VPILSLRRAHPIRERRMSHPANALRLKKIILQAHELAPSPDALRVPKVAGTLRCAVAPHEVLAEVNVPTRRLPEKERNNPDPSPSGRGWPQGG